MSLITFIYISICFFVIVFSLLQQNQSGGMGVLGGSSDTLLGTQQASFLSKIVTFFAVLYFSCSFFLNIISSSQTPEFTPLQQPEELTLEPADSSASKPKSEEKSEKKSEKKAMEKKKTQSDSKNSDQKTPKNKKKSE